MIRKPTWSTARAFSLVEMLCVVSVISLLAALLVPSLSSARENSRRAACGANLHAVHAGLLMYAATYRQAMPPFSYSDTTADMATSGHWGGPDQAADPTQTGRKLIQGSNLCAVNLWAVVSEQMIGQDALVCPSAGMTGGASLFAYTRRFSTYGLRFPYSQDLFVSAPDLANWPGQGLLGGYETAAGGQIPLGKGGTQVLPAVRWDRQYRLSLASQGISGTFDPAAGAIASDMFCQPDHKAAAPTPAAGQKTYAVTWARSHGQYFNVLLGGGAIRLIDGGTTVVPQGPPPTGSSAQKMELYAAYAERIWQYFEQQATKK